MAIKGGTKVVGGTKTGDMGHMKMTPKKGGGKKKGTLKK